MRKKPKKRTNKTQTEKVMNNICENIADILLESKVYPGTREFNEVYNSLIKTMSDEMKIQIISIIRDTIDS